MKVGRRLCATALSAMLVGALLALPAPASADTSEAFAGTAGARALNISLLGINVTVGSSNALANSTPSAKASGAGVLLVPGTATAVEANGPNASQGPVESCLNVPIPPVLVLTAACSRASASTTNASPTASSRATVADLDVLPDLGDELLAQILAALQPLAGDLLGDVAGTVDPLLGGLLGPLLGNLGLDLGDPVQSLIDALDDVTSLIDVSVGNSTSEVITGAGKVTATATALGGRVDILPGLTVAGGPLASITLGSARATAEYDRGTGKSTPSFDPALIRLSVLGGAPISIGLGTPLPPLVAGLVSLSVGGGRTVTNPDGTVGAVADGLSLSLLGGTVLLELAHAEAAAGGARATITTQSSSPPVRVRELARTGPEPWLPLGALLLLAAYVTRRVARVRP